MSFVTYIGIGSNVGDRHQFCREAVLRLSSPETDVTQVSSLYETTPVDYKNQPHFYNAVVEVKTTHDPFALLKQCQQIEQQLGKKIIIPKGPRTLDLDILFYGDQIIWKPDLIIPHPSALKRLFVLVPFVEIAPYYIPPGEHQTVKDLLEKIPRGLGIQKVSAEWI